MILVPTILSGGSGSRLWPLSRTLRPKPFIRVTGGESLLQKAFLRGQALPHVSEILTVTNRDLFFQTEDEYRSIKGPTTTRYILEPFGRNTAAAICAAALEVQEAYGPDALLLVLAADHIVTDQAAFAAAVQQASVLAQGGKLVTFGIQPTAPETGFGYIEHRGTEVVRFIEKPDAAKAQAYLDQGGFLWNSGMFCFAAGVFLQQMAMHAPEILHATKDCITHASRSTGDAGQQLSLTPETFATVPDISIDYALMERSKDVAVVPCTIGWSDVGSWNALSTLVTGEPDEAGNRIVGEAVLHDTRNCYIQSEGRLIGAVGLSDMLIVDTPDALLVADRRHAQDVKHIFTELQRRAHDAHRLHRTAHRPWGTYTVLEEGHGFKIKRIEVQPGCSLSLQMHQHRSEHWVVVSGSALVVNGNREFRVEANESTYIPAGNRHRLTNPGTVPLVIIETQTGHYLGEDDIVRLQDVYGRA